MQSVTVKLNENDHVLALERLGEPSEGRWIARGRLPFNGLLSMPAKRAALQATNQTEATKPQATERVNGDGETLLEGIASSTSVDWHGTEMSIGALDVMARQFKAGVPYVPSHHEDEWDQVFGRTIDAEVIEGRVVNAAKTNEPTEGYLLKVVTTVYTEDQRGKRLVEMVDRGQTIGWSIGGWFTELTILTNEQDEVERIIIQGVELDHLATTRRPSNPDSWIGELSRSVSGAMANVSRSSKTKEIQMIDLISQEEEKAPDAPLVETRTTNDSEKQSVNADVKGASHAETTVEVMPAPDAVSDVGELDCIKQAETALDTSGKTSEHIEEDNKAQRSPSPLDSETTSPKQEDGAMSDRPKSETTEAPADGSATIAATLTDMRTLLEGLVSRNANADDNNDKPTKKVEVAPESAPNPDMAVMRDRIAELEGLVGKLTEAPQRRGHSHHPAERRVDLTNANSIVRAAAQELGAESALVAVAQEQAERRSATTDKLPSRAQLEADLRSILYAALADGVITDPATRSTWR